MLVCVGFVHFIHREVLDTFPQLIEQCHRRLIALLTQWKTLAQTSSKVMMSSTRVEDHSISDEVMKLLL